MQSITYPKINSLWQRNENGKILPGVLSRIEFLTINDWVFTEKIDGTNIRIAWIDGKVQLLGRKDKSQIPKNLLDYLQATFTVDLMKLCGDYGKCTYNV